jgi:hypothetical protein
VLRKWNCIVAKTKSRYLRTMDKVGNRVPNSVQEALAIDGETGTDFWRRALVEQGVQCEELFKGS